MKMSADKQKNLPATDPSDYRKAHLLGFSNKKRENIWTLTRWCTRPLTTKNKQTIGEQAFLS